MSSNVLAIKAWKEERRKRNYAAKVGDGSCAHREGASFERPRVQLE